SATREGGTTLTASSTSGSTSGCTAAYTWPASVAPSRPTSTYGPMERGSSGAVGARSGGTRTEIARSERRLIVVLSQKVRGEVLKRAAVASRWFPSLSGELGHLVRLRRFYPPLWGRPSKYATPCGEFFTEGAWPAASPPGAGRGKDGAAGRGAGSAAPRPVVDRKSAIVSDPIRFFLRRRPDLPGRTAADRRPSLPTPGRSASNPNDLKR